VVAARAWPMAPGRPQATGAEGENLIRPAVVYCKDLSATWGTGDVQRLTTGQDELPVHRFVVTRQDMWYGGTAWIRAEGARGDISGDRAE